MLRSWRIFFYILTEIMPSFITGIIIFIFILLMSQILRLTEFVLVHGVSMANISDIILYLSISFVPLILPMSLIFSILLTYGRLSHDSEIIALKSSGLNMLQIAYPAIFMGIFVFFLSSYTSFFVGPWGNRNFEVLMHQIAKSKTSINIREGVFSEGFFDMVVYANKVDNDKGLLQQVFIYDERNEDTPLSIVAQKGQIIQEKDFTGLWAKLRLSQGSIHKSFGKTYTIIDFDNYDINLSNPFQISNKNKSIASYNYYDFLDAELDTKIKAKLKRGLNIEWHKRWSIAFACIIFSVLGVALGTITNHRSGKSSGFVISLAVIVTYWFSYVSSEQVLKNHEFIPVWLGVWASNIFFCLFSIWRFKKNWS